MDLDLGGGGAKVDAFVEARLGSLVWRSPVVAARGAGRLAVKWRREAWLPPRGHPRGAFDSYS